MKKGEGGDSMKKLIVKIQAAMELLENELAKSTEIKAAAGRARKLTLNLTKLFKEFRKASVEFHKK